MIHIENLNFTIKEKVILNNINFNIDTGEIIIIAGKNGAGKTTFLKAAFGLENRIKGHCKYLGVDLYGTNRIDIIENIGFCIYKDAFYEHLSVWQNLVIFRSYLKKPYFSSEEVVDMFNLNFIRNQKFANLSMGQKQMLSIAASFFSNPKILVMDEPFNGIDNNNLEIILKLISNFKNKQNTSFLISSHDLSIVESIYTRFVVINSGNLIIDNSKIDINKSLYEYYKDIK